MNPSFAQTIRSANAALFGKGELDRVAEFFTADYVVQLTRGMAKGHGAIRQYVRMLQSAFPKLEVKVEILVEEADRVAWQRTFSGIQRGPFYGFPAIGRRIQWREMLTSSFRGDRIAQEWLVSDLAEQLLRARKGSSASR